MQIMTNQELFQNAINLMGQRQYLPAAEMAFAAQTGAWISQDEKAMSIFQRAASIARRASDLVLRTTGCSPADKRRALVINVGSRKHSESAILALTADL
jgi:hypothetical protein